mmetsp:Transcript_19172/g.53256  ORF Transcript_19172/g.53256 Transcript_19172/m.53256 type:complete len:214 (-) Transcript_19172:464-1105(-)|eukprot:CAMPEP_0198117526 /NCGR_PEP_ID=MMETSP1442-20131203/18428_1 /TAXON_ID= /ORGANISM="Craspedostauros australis, Strain CCMP3328" /LENGTH=213 /DNA_ID=CAMNT_0043775591 /DNA_START=125 /DNA_END=766 /DNA_ORIENTATION=+
MTLAPLLPTIDAILVLDGEGSRLAGKYYGDFLKAPETAAKSSEDLRSDFEKQLQIKFGGVVARMDAAEVVTVMGKTAVFCGGANQGGAGGGDVRIVHVGASNESELVLAHLCEGMYEALSQLMGGNTDRTMVLDNLELVFLLIDEHCDGGIILETDPTKLSSAVLLRDDDGAMEDAAQPGMAQTQGMPSGVSGEMGLAQALLKARDQFFSGAL